MPLPSWKKLLFTSGLALLPACGMEAPRTEALTQPGQRRDDLSLGSETSTLPARGGYGGRPSVLSCPANQVAVGVRGTVVTYVNTLGLICRELNATGTLGSVSYTGTAGPNWGNGFSIQCPEGMAIVGLQGRSGTLLDAIGLHCAAPTSWMGSAQVQGSVYEVGNHSGGNAFSDVCSREQVVTRLSVRTGDDVDQQQATCTRMQALPATSCLDIKNQIPSATDGAYTLYVGGDLNKPWTAWCHDMAGTPVEYLPLSATGASANVSQYTAGAYNRSTTDVRTVFTKIRLDPATLRVSTGDLRFSTSTGQLSHGDTTVTAMSYAAAMNCDFSNNGLANVDLSGTAFSVAPDQFAAAGYAASGGTQYSADNQVVDLANQGYCGWNSVQGADHPFNGRNFSLQLQYGTTTPPPQPPAQPSSGSFQFNASNTNDATQNTTPFDVRLTAGQTLQFGTCTVPGSSGSGDTYLRLYAPDGSQVAGNDDSCGTLSFARYTASQTGTYRIQAGCYSGNSCGGTVAYTLQ